MANINTISKNPLVKKIIEGEAKEEEAKPEGKEKKEEGGKEKKK